MHSATAPPTKVTFDPGCRETAGVPERLYRAGGSFATSQRKLYARRRSGRRLRCMSLRRRQRLLRSRDAY